MKRHGKWIILGMVLFIIGGIACRVTFLNATTYGFQEETYAQNQWVPLDGNFFYNSAEHTEVYSVRVSSAETLSYEEFMGRFEKPLDYLGEESRHDVILLKVDFKNENNTQGGVYIRDFNLKNESLSQYFNTNATYMGIANPEFDPYTEGIRVQPGTESSLYFVYDTLVRADKITYLEQLRGKDSVTMFLNVSLYPVNQMIRLDIPLEL